jgi:hypothetical protein
VTAVDGRGEQVDAVVPVLFRLVKAGAAGEDEVRAIKQLLLQV